MEGICSAEWKELDDLGYEERRREEERSDKRLGGEGGREVRRQKDQRLYPHVGVM